MAGFFTELKRRNVFRVGVAYTVAAWLVVQIVDTLVPMLGVPDWFGRAVLILLAAGFPVALVIAWAFELAATAARRVPLYTYAFWLPVMGDARRTARFKELVRELGLVDYWRTRGWPTHCRPNGEEDFQCI